jgi:hypothetical protein
MTMTKSAARTLYDNPESVAADRAAARALVPAAQPRDSGAQLYGYSAVEGEVQARGAELWAATGAGEVEQRRTRDLFVDIAKSGVPEGLVVSLARQFLDSELAFAREITDDDDVREMERRVALGNEQTREAFRTQYGDQDGERMFARVQRFVRANPKLAHVLEQHGLGSRPDIAMGLAAHVFSTGYR